MQEGFENAKILGCDPEIIYVAAPYEVRREPCGNEVPSSSRATVAAQVIKESVELLISFDPRRDLKNLLVVLEPCHERLKGVALPPLLYPKFVHAIGIRGINFYIQCLVHCGTAA